MDDKRLQEIIKETAYMVANATKKENSGLISDVKNAHHEIKTELIGINARLDKLNHTVAKNVDKLAGHDIMNAQTLLTQKQIVDSMDKLNKVTGENTVFRLRADGSIGTIKWLIGVIGLGNIAVIIKLFV